MVFRKSLDGGRYGGWGGDVMDYIRCEEWICQCDVENSEDFQGINLAAA